ncbi:MAG: serine hydrolase domain-containing protein [Phycisphaerales bacterium]
MARSLELRARRLRSLLVLGALLASLPGTDPALARPEPPDEPAPVNAPAAPAVRDLAATLEPIRAKHALPALAGAIITGDGLIALGATGRRRVDHPEPVTTSDLWHLGSCTKAMTATLAALLVERGTLTWTTTLADAFPDLAPDMHADFRRVTLEQLCTNRGGVPGNLDADGLWDKLWRHKGEPLEARRELLRGVVRRAPEYTPGTRTLYSNAGFAIAGHMCERAAGKPYEALLRELLFEPLGMRSAGFGAPGAPEADPPDQPRGHRDGKPHEPTADGRGADNPPAITPAGRVHASLGDWARFVGLHLRGARRLDPDAAPQPAEQVGAITLRDETFRKLLTPPAEGTDYAFGWARTTRPWARTRELGAPAANTRPGTVFTHSGSNTLWFCVTWIAPGRDFAVLVCTNQGGDDGAKAADEAAWALIQQAP